MIDINLDREDYKDLLSGKKNEEYFFINPFNTMRFKRMGLLNHNNTPNYQNKKITILNGHMNPTQSFTANVTLTRRQKKNIHDSILNPNRELYVLHIIDIIPE